MAGILIRGSELYMVGLITMLLLTTKLVAGCSIRGQVFCDRCGDGGFTTGDFDVSPVKVNVSCLVYIGSSMGMYSGVATTDTFGNFKAPLTATTNYFGQPNVDAGFLFALFVGSNANYPRKTNGGVKYCQLTILSAPPSCSILGVQNGACVKGAGNGRYPTEFAIVKNNGSSSADLLLELGGSFYNSVCLHPIIPPPGALRTLDTFTCSGVKGDPHYTGADGSHFDFSGEPDANFCLLSDAHLHINAYYGGRFGEYEGNTHKALTWIRKLGIMWGHHTITLAAREGSRWEYDNGYMARMEVDGNEVVLSQAGDSATFVDGKVELAWLAAKHRSGDDLVDIYHVKIAGVMIMRLTLRPEVEVLRTKKDGTVHFDFELPSLDVSENAHGVLGQTFRSDRQDKLSTQKLVFSEILHTEVVPGDNGEGFLDGTIADYKSSGLLQADCRVAHFARADARDLETARAIELASGAAVSTTETRKMLRSSVV